MLMAMYSTLAERKVAAWLQDRVGPNRAGKGGLLQPLADGLKLFAKEEFEPDTPNRFFCFTPAIAMTTALMTSAVIPWAIDFIFSARISYYRQLTLMLLLYLIGVMSIGVYGIMIGGWASNNKFSLIGAVRAASQMISYE
jgi:NADH-quinone oxidoreductase subunit H